MLSDKQTLQFKAGMKVFFCAVTEWELDESEAMLLLGCNDKNVYDKYKSGSVPNTSSNLLHRLSLITAIYGELRNLYTQENILLWLKNDSQLESKWHGLSPLTSMKEDFSGLVDVLDHLITLTSLKPSVQRATENQS